MKRLGSLLVGIVLIAGGVTAAIAVITRLEAPPAGVREVIWDKQPCRECGMAVSSAAFAAQLHSADGQIFDFDDPGCLFAYVLREQPNIHAVYFHAMDSEHWLSESEVGFVPTTGSPMDLGWGAVRRASSSSAITYQDAIKKHAESQSSKSRARN